MQCPVGFMFGFYAGIRCGVDDLQALGSIPALAISVFICLVMYLSSLKGFYLDA